MCDGAELGGLCQNKLDSITKLFNGQLAFHMAREQLCKQHYHLSINLPEQSTAHSNIFVWVQFNLV